MCLAYVASLVAVWLHFNKRCEKLAEAETQIATAALAIKKEVDANAEEINAVRDALDDFIAEYGDTMEEVRKSEEAFQAGIASINNYSAEIAGRNDI